MQNLIQSAPKAVRYIIFLTFLIVLVAVIPFFLHLFGFHCDSHRQVQTTSFLNLLDNVQLATTDPKESFNSSSYTPFKYKGIEDCVYRIRKHTDDLYFICDDNVTPDCNYALMATPQLFSDELACIYQINYSVIKVTNEGYTFLPITAPFVFSNAYRKPESEISWFRQTFSCNDDCVPPEHYYWNHLDGTFTCLDMDVCGLNNTRVIYKVDQLLKNSGASRLYSDLQDDKDYKAAVKISCDGDYKPQITIFKIPIFDYKLWLLLFVVGLLFFFLNKVKEH